MKTATEAKEFFEQFKCFTIEALSVLAPNCPPDQELKTRPWAPAGKGGPMGVIYHYTGGPDGIASTRWANENESNTGSSWHVTLLDYEIAELHSIRLRYPMVLEYLPVTGLFIASLDESTWHGNWTNSRCFGIENRNLGKLTRSKHGKYVRGKYECKKAAVVIRDQAWEPYTRGQLIANVNIARALRLIQESKDAPFLPEWNLPHSAVYGPGTDKNDTGSAFPMYDVRAAVFANRFNPEHWFKAYEDHRIVSYEEGESFDEEMADLERDCSPPLVSEPDPLFLVDDEEVMKKAGLFNWRMRLPWTRRALDRLGYHTVYPRAETMLDPVTERSVMIFQSATHAKNWKAKYGPLKVDKIPAKKTITALMQAMDHFNIQYKNPLE